jgi:hypothetical protein
MNEFEDWLMTLPVQTLTDELKIEIISEVNALMQKELVEMLRNMSGK